MNYEYVKDTILCNYEPCDGCVENAQMVDGKWYAPLWGCDTLSKVLDDIKTAFEVAQKTDTQQINGVISLLNQAKGCLVLDGADGIGKCKMKINSALAKLQH